MESINQTTFTEEEAINITIQNGYDGSELNTKVWEQRGCLKPNRTLESLIKKLQTIYEHVEVTGTGKKRKYILQSKKESITQVEHNYKGTLPSDEDLIMQEYIYNFLVSNGGNNMTYKSWATYLGFINVNEFNPEELIAAIKDYHYGFPTIYNPKEVVSIFLQTLHLRNKDVIERSFKRLFKNNRITFVEKFNFHLIEDEYIEVEKELYYRIFAELKMFIEAKGYSYYIYTQAVSSMYKTDNIKTLLEDVKEFLNDTYGIEKIFKSFQVNPIIYQKDTSITKVDFQEAYFKRLIHLSSERQQKSEYKDSLNFRKRFFYINTLILLKHIGIDVTEKLSEAGSYHVWDKEDYALDYMNYHFEQREKDNAFKK